MTQQEFLARLVERLDYAGVSYMIAGSLGSTYYGEPRATNDVDLVIDPTRERLEAFVASLGEGWYVSQTAVDQAWINRSMFNVIDLASGWKADLILRKDRPFSREEFRRRTAANLLGVDVFVVSREDAILSKLEWAKLSSSERQLRDALGVAMLAGTELDRSYLEHWACQLGVEDELRTILSQADSSR